VSSLWDIVKTVGANVISNSVPGGAILLAGINALLPEDKQLPADATDQQAQDAISALPPEQRAAVMEKKFDVQLAQINQSGETLRTMLVQDAVNPQSTRPKIAYQGFQVVAAISLIIVATWAYAVITENADMVEKIQTGWPFVAAIVLPFVGWINSYFGKLVVEQRQKLDAATGRTAPHGIAGLLSGLVGKK